MEKSQLRIFALLFLFVCAFSFSGWSQKKDYLEIRATIATEDGQLDGSYLEIETNEKEKNVFTFKSDPKFIYRLKFQNNYKLTFSKPGAYSRIILISTLVPKAVLDINSDFPPIEFQVNLLNEIEGIDKSFSLQPYASIFYDKTIDDFTSKQNFDGGMIAFQLDQAFEQEKNLNKTKKTLNKLELQELQEMQKEFDRLIREADGLFNRAQYTEALSKYQDASKLFPDQSYPLDRIKEIQNLLDALRLANQQQKDVAQQVAQIIQQADEQFNKKLYTDARSLYQQALQLMADNEQAKKRIAEIDQILQQQNKTQQFNEVLARAESSFSAKEYQQARDLFSQAATILPTDTRPGARIAEIDRLIQSIAEQNAREKNYQQAMQDGEQQLARKKLNEAITAFRKALEYKANDATALQNISKIEAMQQETASQQSYNNAIADADKAFKKKDYSSAEDFYKQALGIKPQEKYPQDQLKQIADFRAAENAAQMRLNNYAKLVRSGDSLMQVASWEQAKTAFTQAQELSPRETYPSRMLLQINQELKKLAAAEALQQEMNRRYQQAIAKADDFFNKKEYAPAKNSYNEALAVKANEKYPAERIAEINRIVQQETDQRYQQAIAEGDRLFNQQNYTEAITAYRKALAEKSDDTYASNQIAEANRLMENLAAEKARQTKLDNDYQRLLSQAAEYAKRDDLLREKDKLGEALALKPNESYPATRITEIDQILEARRVASENARLYSESIAAGQKAFNNDQLQEAQNAFTQALAYKPNDPLALKRIEEIKAILQQRIEQERISKMEEQQRLAAEKANREKYDQLITAADASLQQKNYEDARSKYVSALSTLPQETYPKQKIKEIDQVLEVTRLQAELTRQQALKDSTQQALEQEYNRLLTQAQQLGNTRKFDEAISLYTDAARTWPAKRNEVNAKINELKDLKRIAEKQMKDYKESIARADQFFHASKYEEAQQVYAEASTILSSEDYPKSQIRIIQSILSKRQSQYSSLIAEADDLVKKEQWFPAKDSYIAALEIKKNDTYATKQIQYVNEKIAQTLAITSEKSITQKAYNDIVKQADNALTQSKPEKAKELLDIAQTLIPEEKYPQKKIEELDQMITQAREDSLREDQNKRIDDRYRQIIAAADQLFREKSYSKAVDSYQNALDVKPGETYPQKQINRIMEITNAATLTPPPSTPATKEKIAVQEKTEQVVLPVLKETISNTDEKEQQYTENIQKADNFFGQKDYSSARFFYFRARDIKPDEQYPKQRIDEIARMIDSSITLDVANAYDQAIQQADIAFNQKQYPVARFHYHKAQDLKPEEQYPEQRIEEIKDLILQMLSEREQQLYNEAIAQADKAYFDKDYSVARFYYQQAKRINPLEEYPQLKLQDLEKLIAQTERDHQYQLYQNSIKQADEALEQGNLSVARFYYQQASNLHKEEAYPKEQLEKIKELISQKKNSTGKATKEE